jgi:hypothetical protein
MWWTAPAPGIEVPHHGGAVRVLDLEPVARSARLVRLRQALGHDALQAHPTSLLEHQLAVSVGVVDHGNAGEPAIGMKPVILPPLMPPLPRIN